MVAVSVGRAYLLGKPCGDRGFLDFLWSLVQSSGIQGLMFFVIHRCLARHEMWDKGFTGARDLERKSSFLDRH